MGLGLHQAIQPAKGPDKGANRRDRRAVAQWSGPRICNPKGWSVDLEDGQKLDERVREEPIWPDLAGKQNPSSNRDHPDGFRDLKHLFSIENNFFTIFWVLLKFLPVEPLVRIRLDPVQTPIPTPLHIWGLLTLPGPINPYLEGDLVPADGHTVPINPAKRTVCVYFRSSKPSTIRVVAPDMTSKLSR